MLPENNDIKFDEMLKKSLKNHHEIVPDDFASELSAKVEKIEKQKALNKVIAQERLSLAGFFILPLMIIGLMIAFPSLITNSGRIISQVHHLICQSLEIIIARWQLFAYYCLALLACLYAFYQMTVEEK
jgi:hypothetical protein